MTRRGWLTCVAAVAALVGTVLPVRAGAAAAPPPVTHQTVNRSADSTTSQVFTMPPGRAVSDLRYSPDGGGVWLAVQEERYGYARYVQEYRFAEDRIVRTVRLRAAYGCPRFELLPSGTRALLACGTTAGLRLWVFHLPTGRVTAGYPVPGYAVHALRGRLSDAELLFSVVTNAGWLGGWNLRTSTVRRLPGTEGYTEGVAAY